MELKDLEKSKKKSVASRFFALTSSMIRRILKICNVISPQAILIFPKNFLDFRSDTIEKQGIINLSSRNYASVLLSDFKFTFLGEVEDAAICPFLYSVLFVHIIA